MVDARHLRASGQDGWLVGARRRQGVADGLLVILGVKGYCGTYRFFDGGACAAPLTPGVQR